MGKEGLVHLPEGQVKGKTFSWNSGQKLLSQKTHLASTKGAGSNFFKDTQGGDGVTSHPTHWEMTSKGSWKPCPDLIFPVLRREAPLRSKGNEEGRGGGREGKDETSSRCMWVSHRAGWCPEESLTFTWYSNCADTIFDQPSHTMLISSVKVWQAHSLFHSWWHSLMMTCRRSYPLQSRKTRQLPDHIQVTCAPLASGTPGTLWCEVNNWDISLTMYQTWQVCQALSIPWWEWRKLSPFCLSVCPHWREKTAIIIIMTKSLANDTSPDSQGLPPPSPPHSPHPSKHSQSKKKKRYKKPGTGEAVKVRGLGFARYVKQKAPGMMEIIFRELQTSWGLRPTA